MKRVILTKNGHRPPPPPPPTASTAAALFGAPPRFLVIIVLSLCSAKETAAPHTLRCSVIAALMCEMPPKRQRHLTHHTALLWLH